MKLDIVTPAQLVFSGEISAISLAGAEGDFGVLPGHAPLIATLRPGVMTVKQDKAETRYVVTSGFADVTPTQVTVLAEDIIAEDDIDLTTTKEQLTAAHAVREALLEADDTGLKLTKLQRHITALEVRLQLAEYWAHHPHP